jgi:hypothetical protein
MEGIDQMNPADILCDICGKKRGRPNNHDLCAIKRKAKHDANKSKVKAKDIAATAPHL